MRTLRGALSRDVSTVWALALAPALAVLAAYPVLASPDGDEILFQSSDLKVYRTVSRRGTPVVVLTNLDAEGNLLVPFAGFTEKSVSAVGQATSGGSADRERGTGGPGEGQRTSDVSGTTRTDSVKVVVKRGGGAGIDDGDVEVTADGSGGTTVIINVNPAAPEAERAPAVVFSYPMVAYGGLAGGFHYPDHLYFLGYGPGNDTPVFFGGLGLSSTDRYARAAGRSWCSGSGCPVGPRHPSP